MLINSNALSIPLATGSVHCVVTSPPYWALRSYDTGANKAYELGAEALHDCLGWARGENCGACYVCHLRMVAAECWRVLRNDGTMFLNLGDSYNGSGGAGGDYGPGGLKEGQPKYKGHNAATLKQKDLVGIPWRVAFALQADGWYLRSDIIWAKPNPMPESVTDRPTKSHEYMFLLSKSPRYYFDADAVKEGNSSTSGKWGKSVITKTATAQGDGRHGKTGFMGGEIGHAEVIDRYYTNGRNIRSVWTIPTAPTPFAHFATYPPRLVTPCIKAGTSKKGCCPVCGAGWVRVVESTGHINKREPAHVPGNTATKQDSTGWAPMRRTSGQWMQSCDCPPAEPIPATVFDPFAGSGTTMLVARKLGRHGVGCDLSYTYLHDIARRRLELDDLDDWQNGAADNVTTDLSGLPMFASAND